jgi:hypothetical protein
MLARVIEDHLRKGGWEFNEQKAWAFPLCGGYISRILRVRTGEGPENEDEPAEKGTVTIRIYDTKITFCHLELDFHDPDAFGHLDRCLKMCREADNCDECAIKKFWLWGKRIHHITGLGKLSVEHPI